MRRMTILSLVFAGVAFLFALADTAVAWKIQPVPSQSNEFVSWFKTISNSATDQLAEPFASAQHEEIVHRVFGCEGDHCRFPQPGMQKSAPAAILAGVRWNDTPPLTLPKTELLPAERFITITDDPERWGVLFRNARKQAEAGSKFGGASLSPVLFRSHFGDMQFLHSMASEEREHAGETKRKILAWARFMYKLAQGDITRGTSIHKTGLGEIDSLFANRDENIQMLFVSQAPWEYQADEDLHLFAMGVLIHMVSDSFPDSHVERDETRGEECRNVRGKSKPGRIRSFHVYIQQDISAHGKAESDVQLAYRMTELIEVNRTLMEYYSGRAPWDTVKTYLECVYDLTDPDAPAGPGSQYRKREEPATEPKMTP